MKIIPGTNIEIGKAYMLGTKDLFVITKIIEKGNPPVGELQWIIRSGFLATNKKDEIYLHKDSLAAKTTSGIKYIFKYKSLKIPSQYQKKNAIKKILK